MAKAGQLRDKDIHVVPSLNPSGPWDKWAAVRYTTYNHLVISSTQRECIKGARKLARKEGVKLKIHGMDGKVRKTVSYN